jgi:hypothetical protein
MTESSVPPATAAAPAAEDGKPRSFMVWTGKRHVFRVKAPEYYWLVTQVKLLGDVPAIEHEVRLIDPDTGEVVGEPVMTDDEGVLRVEVPQNKAYHLQLADPEPEPADAPPPEQHVDEEHAILRCQFVHASGEPLAEAEIHARLGEHEMMLTTDEEGRIESPAHLGDYELSWGEQVFHAHALPGSYGEKDEGVYHFVVADEAGVEGEPAGEESGESPEDHLEHHDVPELEHEGEEPA